VVTRTAFDTSVLVAAMQRWHPDNERASTAVSRALDETKKPLLPVTALLQTYSVLTRMPRGLRMSPQEALELLHDNFAKRTELAPHDAHAAWMFLGRAVAAGVSGGGIHDADILECAERAGATRLLTLNPRDFERLGPTSVEVVEP
jgi:predicted nucleic acid-binding protein